MHFMSGWLINSDWLFYSFSCSRCQPFAIVFLLFVWAGAVRSCVSLFFCFFLAADIFPLDRQDVFRGSTQQFEELIPPDVGCCSLHWRWAKTDKSCVLSSVWWVCVCVEELIHLTRRADSPWRPGTPRSTCHSSIFNSSHLFWVPSSQFQPVSTWPFFFLCLGEGRTFSLFLLYTWS